MRWARAAALCGLLVLGWPSPASAEDPSWRPDEETRALWDLLEQPCLAVQGSLVRTGASSAALPIAWPLILAVLDAVRVEPSLAADAPALRGRVDAEVTRQQPVDPAVAQEMLSRLVAVANEGRVAFGENNWSNPAAILLYRVLGTPEAQQSWRLAIDLAGQPEEVQRAAQAQYGEAATRTICQRSPADPRR